MNEKLTIFKTLLYLGMLGLFLLMMKAHVDYFTEKKKELNEERS